MDIYVTAYFNNILIYLDNVKDYERYINNILERLRKVGFNIDINKCEFYITCIKYLNLIITLGRIEIDPVKVKVILE